MAKEKGYFDAMCLDVDLKSSFSTANYPLVAAGQAQFASGGNYSEVLTQSTGGAKFSVVVDDGKTGIDALLVKPDAGVTTLADLKGKTIGVLGAITPGVKAMLFKAGLVEGKDYKTVLLDGFDPVAHFQQAIAGRPGYKSNEPRHPRAGRRAVHAVRPGRRGHPRLVRDHLHVAGLPGQAPDGGRRTSCGRR